MGHHRLLTHRAFETHPWLNALLLLMGAMAFEGRPGDWASTHRKHHAHSDAAGEPHSPVVSLLAFGEG